MSEYILSHKNCPDGCASAILVKKVYPEARIHMLNHNILNDFYERLINKAPEGSTIVVIDICPDKAFLQVSLEKIQKKNLRVEIFDHHQTNDWLENFNSGEEPSPKKSSLEANFSDQACASLMFWEKYQEEYPELKSYENFVRAINDRDLWINEIKEGKVLAKLHQVIGDNKFTERFLLNPSLELDEKEKYALEIELNKENKRNELLLNKMEIKDDLDKKRYGVVYGEANSSDLLNQAIINYDLDYAILINLNSKKGSIRSNGKFDCAEYAEKFGGGGHHNAAGFRVKFDYPKF